MNYPEDFINKIICGDCLEVMKNIPDNSIDLVVTSPPYNFGGFNRDGKRSDYVEFKDKLTDLEYKEWTKKYFLEIFRILKSTGMFYLNIKGKWVNYNYEHPFWISSLSEFKLLNIIIWNFPSGADVAKIKWYPRHEYIFVFIKSKNYKFREEFAIYTDVWKIPHVVFGCSEYTIHPAQYPIKLISRIIESSSNENDLILDPFGGSGTTAVVCKKTNRRSITIEINPEYCAIAEKRLKAVPERLDNILRLKE